MLLVYVTEIKGNKFSVTQHFASRCHQSFFPFTFISILRALSPVGPCFFSHLLLLLSNSDFFLFMSSTLAGSDLILKIPFPQFCYLSSYCIFLLFPLFSKLTPNKIDVSWHCIFYHIYSFAAQNLSLTELIFFPFTPVGSHSLATQCTGHF